MMPTAGAVSAASGAAGFADNICLLVGPCMMLSVVLVHVVAVNKVIEVTMPHPEKQTRLSSKK